jgi:protoporphyrinogen/coproporphyrinogen III oxidase
VPAVEAADLMQASAPKFAEAARQLRSAPVTVVHLGLRKDAVPRGFGMIDADGTLHGVGMLLPSSMLPDRAPHGRALVTAICGGALHPERAALADDELVGAVMADLRATWGVRDAPDYVRVVRWDAAIPQYAPGHRERVREARELLADLPPLQVAGAAWDGVGVPDVALSGATAAARLLR